MIHRLVLAILLSIVVSNNVSASDKPEIFVQLGHQWGYSCYFCVKFASFSADGKYLVTAGVDKTVKLWDVGSGAEIRSFAGHDAEVTAAAVSSDGRLVVSGDEKGIIKIWDAVTGRQIERVNPSKYMVLFLAFSPNDKVFSSISIGDAFIWNASTGQLLRTVEQPHFILKHTSGEAFVLTDKARGQFSLVELATGKEKLAFNHKSRIVAFSFSRDGRYGLLGSNEHNANTMKFELLDMPANKKIAEWSDECKDYSSVSLSVALSPDAKYALTVLASKDCARKGVTLWDTFNGKAIRQITTSDSTFAAFSPDGRSFITLGDYIPTLWETATGNIIRSFAGRPLSRYSAARLSPDGRHAIVEGNPGKPTPPFLMDTATGDIKKVFSGYSRPSFIDNGHLLMFNDGRKKMVIWDAAEGKVIKELKGVYAWYSKDKRYMGEKMSDKEVKVWEVASNKEIMSYTETSGALGEVAFSENSKHLMLIRDNYVKLIDIETGVEGRTFHVEDGYTSSWLGADVKTSADGRYLIIKYLKGNDIVRGENNISLWEIGSGRKIWTIADTRTMRSRVLNLSPDGKTMAVVHKHYKGQMGAHQKLEYLHDGSSIHIYETATGKKIRAFAREDKEYIEPIVFSTSGKYLFSGSERGDISQWDVSIGRKIQSFAGHKSDIRSIEESPDGKRFITCGNDGTVRFWDIESGREIAQLVNFTDGEWVVITPEGYFNASPNGAKYLNVRIGNNVYSIDNFYEKFFNPVYVASVLQGKKVEAVADIRKGIFNSA